MHQNLQFHGKKRVFFIQSAHFVICQSTELNVISLVWNNRCRYFHRFFIILFVKGPLFSLGFDAMRYTSAIRCLCSISFDI